MTENSSWALLLLLALLWLCFVSLRLLAKVTVTITERNVNEFKHVEQSKTRRTGPYALPTRQFTHDPITCQHKGRKTICVYWMHASFFCHDCGLHWEKWIETMKSL